ncbi:hypothetical protein Lal_00043152 [Lupinus albus]|nr:putative plastid lipid-associated protein/fibrillin [Lupinus albus]KAF1890772.1 hypothetical protein Lal_00043152 [Lupinus albus]
MASSLYQLHCSIFSLKSTTSIPPPRSPVVGSWTKPIGKSRLLADIPRPVFCVRAVTYDADNENGSGVAVVEEVKKTEAEKLKKALVDSFYGTNRGLKVTSETRAEIVELITQLEAFNPTPAPTDSLTLLNGKWILA